MKTGEQKRTEALQRLERQWERITDSRRRRPAWLDERYAGQAVRIRQEIDHLRMIQGEGE